jgi:hypothetical protein
MINCHLEETENSSDDGAMGRVMDQKITSREAASFHLEQLRNSYQEAVSKLSLIATLADYQRPLAFLFMRPAYRRRLEFVINQLTGLLTLMRQEQDFCVSMSWEKDALKSIPLEDNIWRFLSPMVRCRIAAPKRYEKLLELLEKRLPILISLERQLLQDAEGPSWRFELDLQLLFAALGPFWIPLTIPFYRFTKHFLSARLSS